MSKRKLSCWILLLHLATNTPCLGRKGHLPSLFQSTGCSPSLRVSIAARPDGIRTTKGCFISTSPEDFFPSLCLRTQGHPISDLHFIGEMRLWHMLSREGLRGRSMLVKPHCSAFCELISGFTSFTKRKKSPQVIFKLFQRKSYCSAQLSNPVVRDS